MFREIYKKIEEYDTIVIARHIGVDPDALASQLALRDAIKLTFPNKKVSAIGTGSAKFYNVGRLDKLEKVENALLIVLDTPDQKRVDSVDFSSFSYMIKIDHHPFVEKFCDLEYIEDTASSTAEIIMNFIMSVDLNCDENIRYNRMIKRGDNIDNAKERIVHDKEKFAFENLVGIDEIINTSVFSINYLSELVYKTYHKLLKERKEN